METELVTIETPELFELALEKAKKLIRKGEVVAVPTETVYGLAANARNVKAVKKIFQVKGRPPANPLIVHIGSIEMARECALIWPSTAELLARKFWPGPLSLVLEKRPTIPAEVTAGGETVALRFPSHPFMQALIQRSKMPLAAPSANLSNRISPTTADHVRQDLHGRIPLIVDAGPAVVGIESTVVDLTVRPYRILRPGMITEEMIRETLGGEAAAPKWNEESGILRSPGLLEKHYAPSASLIILKWNSEEDLLQQLALRNISAKDAYIITHEQIPEEGKFKQVSLIPLDAEAYARALYAELHRADEIGSQTIVVEQVPSGSDWEGIRDRLMRAAAR